MSAKISSLISLKRVSLTGLALALAAPQLSAQIDTLVPGAQQYGTSDWYQSDWMGLLYAEEDWLPWLFSVDSGWWYAREDGWWFSAQQVATLPQLSGLSEAQISAISTLVENALEAYDVPGAVVSIKFAGQPAWSAGYGFSELPSGENEEGILMGPDDHFRIGSASKTFIGMAALRLINEKQLAFETRIHNHLDEAVLSNYAKDVITVRMLLQHTSGINNYTNIIGDWFMPYITDRTRVWTAEELVELINVRYDQAPAAGGKVFDPGAGWFYSNTNTVLLGMVIEDITGMPIWDYIHETFIEPLGLDNTLYPEPGDSTLPEPYARGYMNWANFTGEQSLPSDLLDVSIYDPTGVGAAGPMISTAADLATWMEAIVNNRNLIGDLRQSHIDWRYFISFSSTSPGESSGSYGMNLAHEPDFTNGANYYIIGHRGQISGYDTAMMYLPEQQVALVVACNRSLEVGQGLPTNALEVALNAIVAELYPELIANNLLPAPSEVGPALREKSGIVTPPARPMPLTEY